jgi:hypothetical protein
MSTTAIAPAELKRLREWAGLSVRQLTAALREAGSRFGNSPSSYAYYENDFKGTYLPVELVEALTPILCGRGSPPIGERQVLALAGFKNDSLWITPMEFDERPSLSRKVEIELDLLPRIIPAVRKEIATLDLTLTSEQEAQLITEICRRVAAAPGSKRYPSFIEWEIAHACRLVKACLQST